MPRFLASLGLIATLFVPSLFSQDTRKVVEPKIPAFCASLDAHLASVNDGKLTLLPSPTNPDPTPSGSRRPSITAPKVKGLRWSPMAPRTPSLAARFSSAKESRWSWIKASLSLNRSIPPLWSLAGQLRHRQPCPARLQAAHLGRACLQRRRHGRWRHRRARRREAAGHGLSRWDLAQQARDGRRQQVPRLIVANHSDNFTLYRITLKNSPNFHVAYNDGNGFTVWGVRSTRPQRLRRNTDGIDPGAGSKNITITHSLHPRRRRQRRHQGRRARRLTNMTVSHNHFYWGHGMSIGSETNGGVSKLRVFDLSLDGPDSGIRIKSMGTRGGLVHDVVYDDICIRNSPRPIDITMAYSANGPVKGPSPPTFKDITLNNVRISGGGKILFDGYDHDHRAQITLDGVWLTDAANPAKPYTYTFDYADIIFGPGGTNLQLSAPSTDVTVTGKPAGKPDSCAAKFVPFPR